jgi:hypothetical protein
MIPSSAIFPKPFDPTQMYFSPVIYLNADISYYHCPVRSDSVIPQERLQSITATNRIIYLFNEHICFPLRAIYDYSQLSAPLTSSTAEKIRTLIRKFLPQYPIIFHEEEKNRKRLELQLRTCNVLQTFYQPELGVLAQCLQTTDFIAKQTAIHLLLGEGPVSVARTIAVEILRQLNQKDTANMFQDPCLGWIIESLPAGSELCFEAQIATVTGVETDAEAEKIVKMVLSTVPIPPGHRLTLEQLLAHNKVHSRSRKKQAAAPVGSSLDVKGSGHHSSGATVHTKVEPVQEEIQRSNQPQSKVCVLL